MAKTAAATEKKTASGKAAKAPAGKKNMNDADELSALALAGKEMEDEQRALTGGQNSFISLVKATSHVLDENSSVYMKGIKPNDYVISSKKLKISDKAQKVDVTIVGMFKLYAEVKRKEHDNEMAPTVRFWMPEQAVQFPMVPGNNFERECNNGNTLVPVHWVFFYLHDFPEIDDALYCFRSKGNSIYSQLEKLVKAESSVCTELRFSMSNQGLVNEKYRKTDYYPKFTVKGRNYKLTEDGKVIKDKNSDLDNATLKEILVRSRQLYEDYKEFKLVGKKSLPALEGPGVRKALPGGTANYEDTEDEAVNF